jgi:hypothetical protein
MLDQNHLIIERDNRPNALIHMLKLIILIRCDHLNYYYVFVAILSDRPC